MKAALVILDGWGLGDHERRDAVKAAETPTFDRVREQGASTRLETHGRRVGLPEGQMGNSEVGHLNIGAGRVVLQDSKRVTDDAESGDLGENDAIASAFDYAADRGGRVHFLGLVSDGGVHSSQSHLHALIRAAADRDVAAVTHAFTDGRDTDPTSGAGYLADLEAVVDEAGTGDVATVCGRYYAMDRDENWERTKRAYDAIVHRDAPHEADSAVAAVEGSYDRGETDEFVEPTVIEGGHALGDGDAAVFFNYRADRARQLTRMLADIRPTWGFETTPPDVRLVTMTEYDNTFDLPVAFPPNQPRDVLGEVVADAGLTQLRIAETEKYAHVTYFLNGGREVEFEGEQRRIVESPDVPTYDQRPEMSAPEVTDTAIDVIEGDARSRSRDGDAVSRDDENQGFSDHASGSASGERSEPRAGDDPDVLVLNYANPDMVGHTGDFDAAVAAVEAVDEQLGRLLDAIRADGGHALVTADHGNADDMGTADDPHTAHTTNPVPFVYLAPDGTAAGRAVREGGTLADVAPTLLELVDVETPEAMTGESLLRASERRGQ